jgi:4-hydroxy-tetrahydrodipicolinate reductase
VTIKVGVFGALGRMGQTVCKAVHDDPQLDLVAVSDPHHAGLDLRQLMGLDSTVHVDAGPVRFEDAGVEVAVDFTELAGARENVRWCAERGLHAVVGTTGFTDDDYAWIQAAFTSSNCVVAPNFAIGAVLMMRFAELAAPWFDSAEIIELHHDKKVDAPSGTALHTARRMAAASATWTPDPTTTEVVPGARGGEGPSGIRVHSVRLRGLIAHQEVLLGTTGQSLSIRHDSYDRTSFMPGVLLAVKEVAGRPGLTVGLGPVLDL